MGLRVTCNNIVSIAGAGSWGTALAVLLGKKGHAVTLWGHTAEQVSDIQKFRENRRYLKGVTLPDTVVVTHDLHQLCIDCNILLLVLPSHAVRSFFSRIVEILPSKLRIISAVKGIENDTLLTMSQVLTSLIPDRLSKKTSPGTGIEVGVLSGPSFAEEVARDVPTAVTLGFSNISTACELQKFFVTDTFRVYASKDLIGLEISAAVKNVMAIATGVCDGLGYGLNTRAALITRGLAEMQRLGMALGADSATFSGLSGLGDLLLTCTGNLSRNRTVGLRLGQGVSLETITSEMIMVAEGIRTTKSLFDLAQKTQVEMPILNEVYQILYRKKKCSLAVNDLLSRELRVE